MLQECLDSSVNDKKTGLRVLWAGPTSHAPSDDPFLSALLFNQVCIKPVVLYTCGSSTAPESVTAIGERFKLPLQEVNAGSKSEASPPI